MRKKQSSFPARHSAEKLYLLVLISRYSMKAGKATYFWRSRRCKEGKYRLKHPHNNHLFNFKNIRQENKQGETCWTFNYFVTRIEIKALTLNLINKGSKHCEIQLHCSRDISSSQLFCRHFDLQYNPNVCVQLWLIGSLLFEEEMPANGDSVQTKPTRPHEVCLMFFCG